MAGQSPVVSTAESGTIAKKEVEEAVSFGAQKTETGRKEKEKSVGAMPIEINAGTALATSAQKKSVSTGLIIGGAAFAIFAIVVVINLMSGKNPPSTPIETQPASTASVPTTAPVAVVNISTPEPTSIPDTPTLEPQPFFVDQFNDDLSHWSSFVTSGDDNKMNIDTEDGRLVFELNDATSDIYAYNIFNDFTYTDVKLDTVVLNRGVNENNVSLICRYTDSGWYEFNIANNGLYWIYAYDSKGLVAKGYNELYTGGSSAIMPGQSTNTYTAICKGNKLSLSINGTSVRTITDTQFNYTEGKIGLSVSSFTVLPVNVQFESLGISKP